MGTRAFTAGLKGVPARLERFPSGSVGEGASATDLNSGAKIRPVNPQIRHTQRSLGAPGLKARPDALPLRCQALRELAGWEGVPGCWDPMPDFMGL